MAKYQIWNKTDSIITPSGAQFTAEEWANRFPWVKLPGVKMIISGGPINGGCAWKGRGFYGAGEYCDSAGGPDCQPEIFTAVMTRR